MQVLNVVSNKTNKPGRKKGYVSSKFGKAHSTATKQSRTGIPGIGYKFQYSKGNYILKITVSWYEGVRGKRKQYKTDYSALKNGILGAVKLALDKRFEKTGIVQMNVRKAWSLISVSLDRERHMLTFKKHTIKLEWLFDY